MSTSTQIATAIVGVTGYEGISLAHVLAYHPYLRVTEVTARSAQGQTLAQALPHTIPSPLAALAISADVREAQLVFLAVPHGVAASLATRYRAEGRKVVDISADFRLKDPALYARWYQHEHPAPAFLSEAVYGLPELHRDDIRKTSLVANPGCFPTTSILALAPAFRHHLIQPDAIVDAKTGVSGAGRSPSRRAHFVETSDSTTAYGVAGHRHLPEIEEELREVAHNARSVSKQRGDQGSDPVITFIPHLIPMNRGLLATCYATLRDGVTEDDVNAAYHTAYDHEPFVQILDRPPETGWVRGSNQCFIHVAAQPDRHRLIVISAIDNLMKGGAGQAVQNANLMFDLPEESGLMQEGGWP